MEKHLVALLERSSAHAPTCVGRKLGQALSALELSTGRHAASAGLGSSLSESVPGRSSPARPALWVVAEAVPSGRLY